MLSQEPDSPTDLDPSLIERVPTVVYDLDTGTTLPLVPGDPDDHAEFHFAPGPQAKPKTRFPAGAGTALPGTPTDPSASGPTGVSSLWDQNNHKPFVAVEKDPLLATFESISTSVHSFGESVIASIDEFKSVHAFVRSDRGIVRDFIASIWDDASQRLRRLLPLAATVILVPVAIVGIVKLHKRHHHKPVIAHLSSNDSQTFTPTQREVFLREMRAEYDDQEQDSRAPGAPAPALPGPAGRPPDMTERLKFEVAAMIANMELNNARSPGDSASFASDAASIPAPATGSRPPVPDDGSGRMSSGLSSRFLTTLVRPAPGVSTSSNAAGAGLKQPWLEDTRPPTVDYTAPVVFTNGDENGIMNELYKVYAPNPHSTLGREAGADLAALYWLRAGSDLQHHQTAKALTDWKRIAVFDPADPIAREARQKMRQYSSGHAPKKKSAAKGAQKKSARSAKHLGALSNGHAAAKSRRA